MGRKLHWCWQKKHLPFGSLCRTTAKSPPPPGRYPRQKPCQHFAELRTTHRAATNPKVWDWFWGTQPPAPSSHHVIVKDLVVVQDPLLSDHQRDEEQRALRRPAVDAHGLHTKERARGRWNILRGKPTIILQCGPRIPHL